jgi:magnesium transporter
MSAVKLPTDKIKAKLRRHRAYKQVSGKIGMSPGTLIPPIDGRTGPTKISAFHYNDVDLTENSPVPNIESVLPAKDVPGVTWIDIDGIHDTKLIEQVGAHFGFHPLVLEDIVTPDQRPKLEDYGDYLFVTLKMLTLQQGETEVKIEEISILCGANYVVTFQETEGDCFEPVRERIRRGKEKLRKAGPDYLMYALIDAIVDNYFAVLEVLGERFESLQEIVITVPEPSTLQTIHRLKNELLYLRKSVWPLRDVVTGLQRSESPLISRSTEIYLRDVHDHTIQVIDTIETFRDMLSSMLDIYLSSVSNRMNAVMKVLTIIATIFIPLTFIAGVYGMNFEFMPELHWRWGYPLIMFFMFSMGTGMLVWFHRKRWL